MELTMQDELLRVREALQAAVAEESNAKRAYSDAQTQHKEYTQRLDETQSLTQSAELSGQHAREELEAIKERETAAAKRIGIYDELVRSHEDQRVQAEAAGDTAIAELHKRCQGIAVKRLRRYRAKHARVKDRAGVLANQLAESNKVLRERQGFSDIYVNQLKGLTYAKETARIRRVDAARSLHEAMDAYDTFVASIGLNDSAEAAIERWNLSLAEWAGVPGEFHGDIIIDHADKEAVNLYFGFTAEGWSGPHGHIVVKGQTMTYRRMPSETNGGHRMCEVPIEAPRPRL